MTYCNWFRKLVNILTEILFVFAIVATIYVFTVPFEGTLRTILFIVCLIAFCILAYLLKGKIRLFIKNIINKLKKVDSNKLLLIIILTMVVLKVIYSIFFSFDATQDGDIEIYNDLANQIVATKSIDTNAISHLLGVAIHLALFKVINLPVHIGMFIVLLIGTIINYFSFKDIIGKEKTFIGIMLYILMPSTMFLTFCPTHEIFLYMYISIIVYILNKLVKETKVVNIVIYSLLIVIFSVLSCLINPSGYIALIIMGLVVVLSKLDIRKRIIILVVLLLSLFGNKTLSNSMNVNEHVTTMNTYTILIHGSNIDSLGEQVDGYPLRQIRNYLANNTYDYSDKGFEEGAKAVLLNQYKELLTHPIKLVELIAHKVYILWSGNHYSIEMANNAEALNSVLYYIFLSISALIYLFTLTIGMLLNKKKEDNLLISNYKLVLLGCFGITLLSVVLNKYTLYVTLFIYLISFYKIDIDD